VIAAITGPIKKPAVETLQAPQPCAPPLDAEGDNKKESEDGDANDNDNDKQVSFSRLVTVQHPEEEGVPVHVEETAKGGEDITYRERLGAYIHPRDMRRLVTPFSASNEPDLIVRRHCMLLNFDPLRAIILRDRLLALVPPGADSLLISLEKRVRGGTIDMSFIDANSDGPPSAPPSDYGGDGSNLDTVSEGSGYPDHDPSDKDGTTTKAGKQGFITKLTGRGRNPEDEGLSMRTVGDNSSAHDFLGDSSHSHNRTSRASAAASSLVNKIKSITHKKDSHLTESTVSDTEMYPEWEELNAKDWIDLPFELQCADAVLHVVCSILSEDTSKLQDLILDYLESVLHGHVGLAEDPLAGLRHIKDSTHEMGSRVKGFVQSMNRILDDDEDMALMNLSRLITHPQRFIKPVTQAELEEEADEPELILENHLQTSLSLEKTLDLIQGQIDTASELVDQKLDSVRNRILFANMIISVLSLCVASASLVGSLFGMNVTNYLEESDNAFKIITTSTVLGTFALMVTIMSALFLSGTIPLPGLSNKR